jgi:hypothetical protein
VSPFPPSTLLKERRHGAAGGSGDALKTAAEDAEEDMGIPIGCGCADQARH